MNKINIKNENKVIKYTINMLIINLLLLFSYIFIGLILRKSNMFFRGWINIICFLAGCCIIFLTIIIVNYYLHTIMKKSLFQKGLTVVSTIISIIITPIIIWLMILIAAFNYAPEHSVYEHERNLIVKVRAYGFHHTIVDYYEPVNFIIMKKSNIESEMYDGSYDRYSRG